MYGLGSGFVGYGRSRHLGVSSGAGGGGGGLPQNISIAQLNSQVAAKGGEAVLAADGASRFSHGIFANAGQMSERAAGQWDWLQITRPNLRMVAYYDTGYLKKINYTNTGGTYFTQDGTGYMSIIDRLFKLASCDADIIVINSPFSGVNNPSVIDGSAYSPASYAAQMEFVISTLLTMLSTKAVGKRAWVVVDELYECDSTYSNQGTWGPGAAGRLSVPNVNIAVSAMLAKYGVPMLPIRSGITRASDGQVFPGLINLADANCNSYAGVFRSDKIHLSPLGGQLYGQIFDIMLDNLGALPKGQLGAATAAGNLVTNPMFTGTGGTVSGTGLAGQLGDSFTASRLAGGATSLSTVALSKVSKVPSRTDLFGSSAITMQQVAITTTANGSTDREAMEIQQTADISALTSGNYYVPYIWVEVDAWDAWRNIQLSSASPTFASGSRNSSSVLASINDANSIVGGNAADAMPLPPTAFSGLLRGQPFKANGTTAQIKMLIGWTKGTGVGTLRITGIQFRPFAYSGSTTPEQVGYDESLATGTTITSPNAYTFDEESTFTITSAGSKWGTWALSGTDLNDNNGVAQFTINQFTGLITPVRGSLSYDAPTDADLNAIYQLTRTLTPFDLRDSPVPQTFNITINDINNGFTDNFNRTDQQIGLGTDIWLRSVKGANGSANVASNVLNVSAATDTTFLLKQNGLAASTTPHNFATRYIRATWKTRTSGSTTGLIIINMVDENNYIAVRTTSSSLVSMIVMTAGVVAGVATWTPWKPNAAGQTYKAQIESQETSPGSGVFQDVLCVYQDDVKLAVASNSPVVTSTFPASRQVGFAARGTSGSTNLCDDLNFRDAAPIATRIGAKALLWDSNSTASIAVSANTVLDLSFLATKTVGTETSYDNVRLGGSFYSDQNIAYSDTDRVRSPGLPAGTWTIDITETGPNMDPRKTTLTMLAS